MTEKRKKPRFQLTARIPEDLCKWVKEKAEEREVSRNVIINECLKRFINSEKKAGQKPEEDK